jgi:hypothetical protein
VPSSSQDLTADICKAPAVDFTALQKDFGYQERDNAAVEFPRRVLTAKVAKAENQPKPGPDSCPKELQIIQEQPGPVIAIPTKDQYEQVSVPPVLPQPKPKEAKKVSPKKGPGGITGRSIARYANVDPQAAKLAARTSPHFAPVFEKPKVTADQAPEDAADPADKVIKPRKSRKKKADGDKEAKKKGAAKVKAVVFAAPRLVSPKQHEAKLKRQDILFGTSSQLRQDLSPAMVRTLQNSLNDAVVDSLEDEGRRSSPITMRFAEAVRSTRGKLWAEGTHGDLDTMWHRLSDIEEPRESEEDEHVDVTTTPPDDTHPCPGEFAPLVEDAVRGSECDSAPVASNGFWLSKGNPTPPPPSAQPVRPPPATVVISSSSPRLSVSPPRVALRPLSTNTRSPTKGIDANKPRAITAIDVMGEPGVPKETEAKKSRGRPRKAVQSDLSSSPTKPRGRPRKISASSPRPQTPRKRGRPRKQCGMQLQGDDAGLGFQHIDDIEDSEPDHTPTPKKRGSPSASQPLPLATTSETEAAGKRVNTAIVNSAHPRWPEVKAKLFPDITNAVRSATPTNSIKNPTWHEKMLLYDPIVLEDLTSWLNEQGVRIEGKDGALVEISCWMTQAWCEMNSICCLWKEGLRGGVRTRY